MSRFAFITFVVIGLANTVHAADEPKPGEDLELNLGKAGKLKLCWVPKGSFRMGSPKGEEGRSDRDEFEHTVELSGFWMAKFHVTQKQFVAVMGMKNLSWFRADGSGKDKVQGIDTHDFPVEQVSWDDAKLWIKEVNRKVASGEVAVPERWKRWKFALPSEAQWEYAARGGRGNRQPFYWGSEMNGTQGNCDGNYPYGTDKKGPFVGRPTPVGSYEMAAPHPWGLCDMAGNVWQWCEDYFGKYENVPAKRDPVQLTKQDENAHSIRGGSWEDGPENCRCAVRGRWEANHRYHAFGFRVVFCSN